MVNRVLIVATLICWASLPIWAVDVPIANAGFEQVVLPCAAGPSCYAAGVATGWIGDYTVTTFKPSTGPGKIFPAGIPEGVNVLSVGGDSSIGVASQTLAATLQPNTTYTLVFSVGSRADFTFAGDSVELLAGSTTLASDSSSSPSSGTFVTGRSSIPQVPPIPRYWGKDSASA